MNFRKVIPLSLLALAFIMPAGHAQNLAWHSQAVVLLPNGNFMVTGGVTDNANTPTAATEIYFTSAAAWGSGGSMAFARSSHTATLLSDGRVLVAGGFANGTPLQSAEIYNTLTQKWSSLGAAIMKSARGGHTATLLDKGTNAGKLMLCGGQTSVDPTQITATCELFDPKTNTFTNFVSMTSPRMGQTASLLPNGNVLVSGGIAYNGAFDYLPTNELFTPDSNAWNPTAALLEGRTSHSATVLNNGDVLIAGGYNTVDQKDQFSMDTPDVQSREDQGTKGYLESVELFDPYGSRLPLSGDEYEVMPYRNSSFSTVLAPDSILHLTGGYGNIPVSYIPGSAIVPPGQALSLTLTPSGTPGTANITGGSLTLKYNVSLSRPVNGRIVNGNIYFSLPQDRSLPTIKFNGTSFYIGRTTATIDALSISKDLQTGIGGKFNTNILLPAPGLNGGGYVTYTDFIVTASPQVQSSDFEFSGPLAANNTTPLLATSAMTLNMTFGVPSVYEGSQMTCVATLLAGQIANTKNLYNITMSTGIAASFVTGTVNGAVATANGVAFTSLGGFITNTTDYSLASGINAAGQTVTSLSLSMKCTGSSVNIISTKDNPITFSADVSTVVIREMIFSDELNYSPSGGSWNFALSTAAVGLPRFNNTDLLTPAADMLELGGRNCEAAPASDCLRGTKNFTPTAAESFLPYQALDWDTGPALNTKRAAHTSTLLPDGTILTCGGSDGTQTLKSCELLKNGAWSYVGNMISPRSAHTATLLPNGTVLMAGGTSGTSTATVNTAEIYYPDTQRFVLTSPMNGPRMNHTATLLPNGNVLLVAGSSGTAYSAASEIFISTAATWEPVADILGTARAQHTATLLKNGTVLVAGGINGLGAVSSVEIFDPASKQWNPATANLHVGRYDHTATLLKDGRVLVAGGSSGAQTLDTAEVFNGTSWTYTHNLPFAGNDMLKPCASHTATLLPNGKVLVSGGEGPSISRGFAQGFDVDFSTWQYQGAIQKRTAHTTILTPDGTLINIGGFDGSNFLNTTDVTNFTYSPDVHGFPTAVQRQPTISSGTLSFNNGDTFTLTSDAANFHGISEASGGGAGPMNASSFHPRIYMRQMDNPSGFLMDMTTSLYTLYGSSNSNWTTTLSSITVITPSSINEMPHGWYDLRVAANGQFSTGHIVQVTIPRPTGLATVPLGTVLGTGSITWTWSLGSLSPADGYDIYASSNNVFIATAAFNPVVSYTQTGLSPNTAASIGVAAYNYGGSGDLVRSATYYTLAAAPTALTINSASFETASLSWNSGNAAGTKFELSVCAGSDFADPVAISTPIAFNMNYTSTSAVLTQLSANTMYYFRVNAMNGAGIPSDYSNHPSTITVASINNLTGTAISSSTISWSWGESQDSSVYYEIYDLVLGTANPVFIASTTYTTYQEQGLSANQPYPVAVRAVKNVSGPVYGPYSYAKSVYTLAVAPDPASGNIFVHVTTGSFTSNWTTNGNSTWTVYGVFISTTADFSAGTRTKSSTLNNNITFYGLQANTRYYVAVEAVNGDGLNTVPTLLGSKYTLARPPVNVVPSLVTMDGVLLTWDANSNPDGTVYEIRMTSTSLAGSDVLTYMPFSGLHTDTSLQVPGLLTSTSYYFDVAAENGEGAVTSRVQAVPNAFTVNGPEGAPAGSVSGTTTPGKTTVISGILPDNQKVTLTIPAQTFPASTDLAVSLSTSDTGSCTPYAICTNPVRTVEVAIYSENNAPPQQPVKFDINYDSQHNCQGLPDTDTLNNLVLARYNPLTKQCLPLETAIDSGNTDITATLNYFGVFALIYKTAAADLGHVAVYPNPFYTNRGYGFVTFNNLPASSKVRIYTLSGNKVWEGTTTTTGIIIWKGVNKSGQLVASGIYLAVIDSSVGKKVMKLAVER